MTADAEQPHLYEALGTCLTRLEAMLDRRGWHERGDTRLWEIRRATGGTLTARPPRRDPHAWPDTPQEPPTLAARRYAQQLHDQRAVRPGQPAARPDDVAGYAWSMEAWTVHGADAMPVHQRDQLDAAVEQREVYRRPDRVECRTVEALLFTGELAQVVRERGGQPQLVGAAGAAVVAADDDAIVPMMLRLLCGVEPAG